MQAASSSNLNWLRDAEHSCGDQLSFCGRLDVRRQFTLRWSYRLPWKRFWKPILFCPPLKIFPPSSSDSRPKDGTPDLHIRFVERVHDGLDVVIVDLIEEILDSLLSLRARRVGADGGRAARCRAPRRGCGGRLVQEQELDVAGCSEAGDVVVEELVDDFEIPGSVSVYLIQVGRSHEHCTTYISPRVHCTSSTMSKLLWTTNWFRCRAWSLKRGWPSPPCLDVPKSYSNRGLSWVPIMAK